MKRSSKILAGALVVLLALSLTGIIISRLYFNSIIGNEHKPAGTVEIKNSKTENYSNKGFNSLTITGHWKTSITRGDRYSVKISGPANLLDKTGVTQDGKTLTITNDNSLILHDNTFSVEVTLPKIEQIKIDGTADLDFTGFAGETLNIVLSGAGRIRGFDSRYENLTLLCSGAGQLDLTKCLTFNADVNLSGAGEILINMDGGVLSGTISGLGSVEYSGRIRENRLKVTGLGSVKSH